MYLPCCPVPCCPGKQGEFFENCLPNLTVPGHGELRGLAKYETGIHVPCMSETNLWTLLGLWLSQWPHLAKLHEGFKWTRFKLIALYCRRQARENYISEVATDEGCSEVELSRFCSLVGVKRIGNVTYLEKRRRSR